VKVLDFGLAKTRRAPNVTQEGAILGTPDYMAPEQVLGEEATPASDIYAFGVMLREMLGAQPSPALSRIVARCLAREPEDRWHSAGILRAALEMGRTAAPGAPPPSRIPMRAAGAAAACAAIVTAGLIWYPFRHEASRVTIAAPGSGVAGRISVSPDGTRVAYTGGGSVWVRALDESEARPVAGTQGAGAPFWSPDGKSLAFTAGGELKTVPATGGMARTLGAVRTAAAGAWSPSGDILIGQIGDGIYRVPAKGGEMVRVTMVDRAKFESRHMSPVALPDGQRFLYVAGSDRPGYNVLWAARLDGEGRRALMNVESGVALAIERGGKRVSLIHMRDRTLMAESFDLNSLECTGPARVLAQSVGWVASQGSVLAIGDFAAAGGTLAYRTASPASGLMNVALSAKVASAEITVLRDWM
ncbi:MAG TPA: protein kinase, partial [Candidatus Solibacter sp.]|nr:protein kinase [Candidatus Solibacter sp.]